jgi:hypothetical protein
MSDYSFAGGFIGLATNLILPVFYQDFTSIVKRFSSQILPAQKIAETHVSAILPVGFCAMSSKQATSYMRLLRFGACLLLLRFSLFQQLRGLFLGLAAALLLDRLTLAHDLIKCFSRELCPRYALDQHIQVGPDGALVKLGQSLDKEMRLMSDRVRVAFSDNILP